MYISFFFQAEDGIRDRNVTGVQTCSSDLDVNHIHVFPRRDFSGLGAPVRFGPWLKETRKLKPDLALDFRSEERRVGKECRCRWARHVQKKKHKPLYESVKQHEFD